ncbi:MAG: peptide chain release factor 2 [bacterium]
MSLHITVDLPSLDARARELRRFLDLDALKSKVAALEAEMVKPTFWDQPQAAQKTSAEATALRRKIELFESVEKRVADLSVLHELTEEENSDLAWLEREKEYKAALAALEEAEIQMLLGKPQDRCDAILSLNAGAGGTEACDWVSRLLRMFQRWAERHGHEVSVLDILPGEEAGVKNVTLMIKGENAYGHLKAERGVHRLVRISPFNAQGKRQTSFASVDVIPEVEDDIEIEIAEKDLRVDVYRSGGHGGQGVNTTDSAVRLTHLPTGLVVTCQNERSQLKNRATALKVLKARLYQIEMDKKRAEMDKSYANKGEIGWGRQIRSYVLQPYQMVKDLRTGEQTSDTQGVLDGDLDAFILAFLKGKKRSDADTDDEE